ncbi:MAG: CvpA family protein [Candidatus Krumholzibacteriota bacterium]|nr:CvpA family protein [Candidatus Krumholzibacteriota bacterium]
MEIVKILVGIVLLFFMISGLRRGLIRQVLEVVGIIAAFIGAYLLAHQLALLIEDKIDIPYNLERTLSAILIFVGIVFLFHLLGRALQKFFKMTLLGSFDRLMGGIFGLLQGVLLISLLMVIILNLSFFEKYEKPIEEDPVTSLIYPVLPVMFDLIIPGDLDFDRVAGRKSEYQKRAKKEWNKRKDQIKKAPDGK